MTRREPVEAYGNLHPVPHTASQAVHRVLADWGLDDSAEVDFSGDLIRFGVRGVCFPLDDMENALTPYATPASQGKIDLIDREAWTLTRLIFDGTRTTRSTVGLNHVLDYAGH